MVAKTTSRSWAMTRSALRSSSARISRGKGRRLESLATREEPSAGQRRVSLRSELQSGRTSYRLCRLKRAAQSKRGRPCRSRYPGGLRISPSGGAAHYSCPRDGRCGAPPLAALHRGAAVDRMLTSPLGLCTLSALARHTFSRPCRYCLDKLHKPCRVSSQLANDSIMPSAQTYIKAISAYVVELHCCPQAKH